MREIKFRAKVEGKVVYSDGFMKHPNGTIIIIIDIMDEGFKTCPIDKGTLEQFTGFKDKKDVDIYDKDKLSYTIFDYNDNDKQYTRVVKWFGSGFVVTQIPDDQGNGEYGIDLFWIHSQDCEIEVIGKINTNKL